MEFIDPVRLNVPVTGSYTSAVLSTLAADSTSRYEARVIPVPALGLAAVYPPAIRARPSANRVAVWNSRGVPIEPVGLKVPVAGSYSSADAQMPSWPAGPQLYPPVNRTRPSSSSVAGDPPRTAVMSPVGVNVPVAGS